MSLLRKLQRLIFRPGEALLLRGRPSFRERDEFGERMRAFVALQNAMREAR